MKSLRHLSIYRLWVVGQNDFASWHPCGKYLVCGLFERHIGTLLPRKVPKQRMNDCPLLNCIAA